METLFIFFRPRFWPFGFSPEGFFELCRCRRNRRLHDTGRFGWRVQMGPVPLAAVIILLTLRTQDSHAGDTTALADYLRRQRS